MLTGRGKSVLDIGFGTAILTTMEEIYFVADEMPEAFPQMRFEPFSFCAGLLTLQKAGEDMTTES